MQITGAIFASLLLLGLSESFPYRFRSSEENDNRGITYIRPRGGGGGGRGGGRQGQRRVNANGGFRSVQVPTGDWPGNRRIVLLTSPNSNRGGSYGSRNEFGRQDPQLVRVVLTPDYDYNDESEENQFGLSELLSLLLGGGRVTPASSNQGNYNRRDNTDRDNRNHRDGGNGNSPAENNDRYGGSPGRERERPNEGSNYGRNRNSGQSLRRGYSPNGVPDRRKQNGGSGQGSVRDRPSSLNERERPHQDLDYGRSKNSERIQDQGDYSYDYEDPTSDSYDDALQITFDYEDENQWLNSGNSNFGKSRSSGKAQNRRNQSPNYGSNGHENFPRSPSEKRNNINRNDECLHDCGESAQYRRNQSPNYGSNGHDNFPNSQAGRRNKVNRNDECLHDCGQTAHNEPQYRRNQSPNYGSNGHDNFPNLQAEKRNSVNGNVECLHECGDSAQNKDSRVNPQKVYNDPRDTSNKIGNRRNNRLSEDSEYDSRGSKLRNQRHPDFDESRHNENADNRLAVNNYESLPNGNKGYRQDPREISRIAGNRNNKRVPGPNEDESNSPTFSKSRPLGNHRQPNSERSQHNNNGDTRSPEHTDITKNLGGEYGDAPKERLITDRRRNTNAMAEEQENDSRSIVRHIDDSKDFGIGSVNQKSPADQRNHRIDEHPRPIRNNVQNTAEHLAESSPQSGTANSDTAAVDGERQVNGGDITQEGNKYKPSEIDRKKEEQNAEKSERIVMKPNRQNRRPSMARKPSVSGPDKEKLLVNKDNVDKPAARVNLQKKENAVELSKDQVTAENRNSNNQEMTKKRSKPEEVVIDVGNNENPMKNVMVSEDGKVEPSARMESTKTRSTDGTKDKTN